MRLANRVAVVTGASSGIGAAITNLFAEQGATVYAGDLRIRSGDAAAKGHAVVARQVDVRSEESVRSLIEEAIRESGRVDILVNNAGVGLNRDVVDTSEEEFNQLFSVNIKGVFFGCKHAIPYMLSGGGGSIVNLSSNGGIIGRPGDPVYCASKHAVMGLTKALAVRYASEHVRVNAICPGPIDTEMLWGEATTPEARAAVLPARVASCPAARYGSPADVAAAALFLASEESSFVNGIGLPVDGAKGAGVMATDRYRLDFKIAI